MSCFTHTPPTVDADALRRARQGTPQGEYHVDADALRRARQGTPQGEYHR